MNFYSLRKLIYVALGEALAEGLIAVGHLLLSQPVDHWTLRPVMIMISTTFVAVMRRKFWPGWLGAPV